MSTDKSKRFWDDDKEDDDDLAFLKKGKAADKANDKAMDQMRRDKAAQGEYGRPKSSGNIDKTSNQDLRALMERAGPLLAQVHHLYNMYFAGVEKRPPLERRAFLDATMNQIQQFAKNTPALRFQSHGILDQYRNYCEL